MPGEPSLKDHSYLPSWMEDIRLLPGNVIMGATDFSRKAPHSGIDKWKTFSFSLFVYI